MLPISIPGFANSVSLEELSKIIKVKLILSISIMPLQNTRNMELKLLLTFGISNDMHPWCVVTKMNFIYT
jgi:hypothetical protein